MTPTTQKRASFRFSPVAAGCAVLLVAASAAQAQQAVDNVVVTGIRASIESAISVKRNAEGVVEAISAEDIGKLPDATVAESIARLPGVTAQRDAATGRAKNVSVRGMSPDFNGATLNGRAQASTGDSRGVEFDQFPAELLSSIVIHKTPNASLVDQGLASTIDMKTVRPLDFNKRTMVVNVRKQSTGIDSGSPVNGSGDRESFSYIDQFADRTIGVVLGYTKQKDIGAVQSDFGSWGTATKTDPVTGKDVIVPNGFNDFNKTTSAKREGLVATLQFKPNKDFETSLDLFTSKNSFSSKTTGIQGGIPGGSGYDPDGVLSKATIANGVATAGTYNNFKGVVRNDNTQGDDKLDSIGWNTKFKLGEWKASADFGRSEVTRQHTRFETTAGQAGNTPASALDTISWTGFDGKNVGSAKFTTGFNYADRNIAKLTDVEGWGGGTATPQAGYYASPVTKDKVDNIRFSGVRNVDFGMLTAVELGLHYSDRDKTRKTAEGAVVIAGGDPYGVATMPGSASATALATGLSVAAFDPVGTLGSVYQLTPWTSTAILNKNFKLNEKVTTTYIKGDLEGKLMGLNFTGNVGGQLVSSNQTSTGYSIDGAACAGEKNQPSCTFTSVTQNYKYNDFNPSLNLNFDAGNDQVVRLGAAKVLSRANMIDMAGNVDLTYNRTDATKPMGWNGSGGNPKLEPFRARSLDLSYEKYFGKKGYVSVAGFYKALDTYIIRSSQVVDFRNYITNPSAYPTTLGTMTTPVNGSGGSISGMEFSLNVPFNMLTPALDGFGLMANTSVTNSSVSLPRSGLTSTDTDKATNLPLPGLSKNVTNLRAYYEKNGFSVSLGAKKRSDFLGEILDYQDNRQLTFVKGETLVDLQAGYEFNTGMFKGLSVLLQGNNLTNAEFIRYNGTPDNVVQRTKFGKIYQIGMNYKF